MILILPCGGESSRFPGVRPKWLLTQPNGNLMVCDSITKLDLRNVTKIVLIAKVENLQGNEESLTRAFLNSGCKVPVEFFNLQQKTSSQPETVAKFVETLSEDVPIFIKDCDGQFDCVVEPENEVIVGDVSRILGSATVSKSYCRLNDRRQVLAIVEKQVISQDFCVGGYSFRSSKEFLSAYNAIKHHDGLYISHVIDYMLMNESNFSGKDCNVYEDWGTLEDWLRYKDTYRTLFLDIDGVLLKNSSEYFQPTWEESEPLQRNVEYINQLQENGRVQVILTTARSSRFSKITTDLLEKWGVKYKTILFDMLHAKRVLINDHSKTNPYPACMSYSVERDSENLSEILA